MEPFYSGYGKVVGFCIDGDEPSGSVTGGDFTYFLNFYPYICVFFCISSSNFIYFSFVAPCLVLRTSCDPG